MHANIMRGLRDCVSVVWLEARCERWPNWDSEKADPRRPTISHTKTFSTDLPPKISINSMYITTVTYTPYKIIPIAAAHLPFFVHLLILSAAAAVSLGCQPTCVRKHYCNKIIRRQMEWRILRVCLLCVLVCVCARLHI